MIYQMFTYILYAYLVLHPKDCSDLKYLDSKSGVYRIYPDNAKPFKVYCDMDTDGGSWMASIMLNHFKCIVIWTLMEDHGR
jgi:hypothetical protein